MKSYDLLPPYIQKLIDAKESREVAKSMNKAEKPVNDALDAFYTQQATDNTNNYDSKEINAFIEL